jgi:hypothetical protein
MPPKILYMTQILPKKYKAIHNPLVVTAQAMSRNAGWERAKLNKLVAYMTRI